MQSLTPRHLLGCLTCALGPFCTKEDNKPACRRDTHSSLSYLLYYFLFFFSFPSANLFFYSSFSHISYSFNNPNSFINCFLSTVFTFISSVESLSVYPIHSFISHLGFLHRIISRRCAFRSFVECFIR